MTIVYDVFRDDGAGGPVDYAAPVLTTSSTSAVVPQPAGSTYVYAVRARDLSTGLSDGNTDARVAAPVDPRGFDAGGVPRPPRGLRVVPTAGGGADVHWSYPHTSGPAPSGFRVYLGPGAPSFARPASSLPYNGRVFFRVSIPPQPAGTYAVAVRAWNAAGEESNTYAVTFTPKAVAPASVAGLAAAASY